SVVAFALTAAATAWIVRRATDSVPAAIVAAAAFALNPNVLYLQATPMTEPLFLGLMLLALALLMDWTESNTSPTWVRWSLVLACLTRYEAWPVTASALLLAAGILWRKGNGFSTALRRVGAVAIYPALTILAFVVLSRVVVGDWFTANGFFVPENKALGRPLQAAAEIWWGTHALSGWLTMTLTAIGFGAVVIRCMAGTARAPALIPLALGASALVPWAAFVRGHPFRIR